MTDFRFLHVADIHLDSPLEGLARYDEAPVKRFREAPRAALVALIDRAIELSVDFLLIAGDLYDGSWDESRTGLFLVGQLARLRDAGIPVIAIRGNHDAENRMTNHVRFPDNVTLLSSERPETYELSSLGVAIHGRSFAQRDVRTNLVLDYPPGRSDRFDIGLLHTALEGREGHESYAPCSIDDLLRCEYDYWALGHIHRRAIVRESPPIVFPGNLQGRYARETGPKGAYVVTVERGRPRLEFEAFDAGRWERIEVPIDGLESLDALVERFRGRADESIRQAEGRPLAARIELTGAGPLHRIWGGDPRRGADELRAAALMTGHEAIWLEKIVARTSPAPRSTGAVRHDVDAPSPVDELDRVLAELLGSDDELRRFIAGFDDLRAKLPRELTVDEAGRAWDDPERWRELLGEALPLLHERIGGGETTR